MSTNPYYASKPAPPDDAPTPNRTRRGLRLLEGLTLALSVVILGLAAANLAYAHDASLRRTTTPISSPGGAPDRIALLPDALALGPLWALCADGIGGAVAGLLALALLFRAPLTRPAAAVALLAVCAAAAARSAVAVAYGFARDRSPDIEPEAVRAADGAYPAAAGELTLYGWNRQLAGLAADAGTGRELTRRYREVEAARDVSVALLILDFVALFTAAYMIWSMHRLASGKGRKGLVMDGNGAGVMQTEDRQRYAAC